MEDIPMTPSSPDGGATPNELLREVRLFVSGATSSSDVSPGEIVRSAIFLLKSLPAAREAVLEHLCNVFDDHVGQFVGHIENNGQKKETSATRGNDFVIEEINGILSDFIVSSPDSWAPIIFTWSLDLLGRLSSKYGDRRGLHMQQKTAAICSAAPANSSDKLNNMLNVWLSCHATKTLIHLGTKCLGSLMNSNVDMCIDSLLDMSAQHSPHFDWFIAHIGSCFPTTIISRVLACGLKDYCSATNQQESSDKRTPKVASAVGILGHLTSQHSEQIRQALLALIKDSIDVDNPTRPQLAAIPFLLQMSSMSPNLLRVVISDIINICLTKESLRKLPALAVKWKESGIITDPENVVKLIVKLIIQSGNDGSKLISFLLDTASADDDAPSQVRFACAEILNILLVELQLLVYDNTSEIPVFSSIATDLSFITRHLIGSNAGVKSIWISRLLSYFCFHSGESITVEVGAFVLRNCADVELLLKLLQYVRQRYPDILSLSVKCAIGGSENDNLNRLFTNLNALVRCNLDDSSFNDALISCLNSISAQFGNKSSDTSSTALDLIVSTPVDYSNIDVSLSSDLCHKTVAFFFSTLLADERDKMATERVIKNCQNLLQMLLSGNPSLLCLVLRLLVCGSLSWRNAKWFGNWRGNDGRVSRKSSSILVENRKHAGNITLPQSHSTVFHAGVLGNGIRIVDDDGNVDAAIVGRNKTHLIDTLMCCCSEKQIVGGDVAVTDVSLKSMSKLSLLLVDIVSPDVMFNGLPWPDEEKTMTTTIERDIQIRKTLDENPILWDMLFLVAGVRPALCYCSVLLRAVAATLLSFWSSCREKSTLNCSKALEVSQRLLRLMSIGELIPPPLSQIGDILPELSAYEASVVLGDLWKFMHDHVPSPDSFIQNDKGQMERNLPFDHAPEKYTTSLRYIMQNKIDRIGHLYPKMFKLR